MNEMNPKDQIIKIVKDALAKKAPGVTPEMLEENGKVYYMNDRDGTIFDWTMNNHACPFMCFFNDGMGAIKVTAHTDGGVAIYLYDAEKPHKFIAEDRAEMKPKDVLALACFLYFNADEAGRFGKSLDDLEYTAPSAEKIAEFQKLCEPEE